MPSSRQQPAKTLGKKSFKSGSEGDLFPRGAAPNATPRVKRRTGQVLFHAPSKRPRLTRGEISIDPSLSVIKHGTILSHAHFIPGSTVLALVKRADKQAVTLALPGGLQASTDPLATLIADGEEGDVAKTWEVLTVGTVVCAAVLEVREKIVWVSLAPELVNVGLRGKSVDVGMGIWGVVKSVEDYGYVISFGSFVKVGGFLPFSQVNGKLKRGEIVHVVVEKKVGKVISVSAKEGKVKKSVGWGGVGGILEGTVLKKGIGGGIVMCGNVKVEVDGMHWGEGGKVMVIYRGEKVVGSLLKEVVAGGVRKLPAWKVGTLLDRVKVVAVRGGGVVMEGEGGLCFAHVSRVDAIEAIKVGMEIAKGARVVSVNEFEGVVNVDMRKNVLQRKALSLEEIVPGEVYECKVSSVTSLGSLIVAIESDSKLIGIVPAVHVTDVPVAPSKLSKLPAFRVGAELKCRVLGVQEKKGKVYMAAKNSLVNPKYPILTQFGEAQEALEKGSALFTGIVRAILRDGAVTVAFCGTLTGLVPVHELCVDTKNDTQQLIAQVEALYPIGQTVHVRLISADSRKRQLSCSMNLQSDADVLGNIKVGQIVDGIITGVDQTSRQLTVSVSVPDEDGDVDMQEQGEDKKGKKNVECYLAFDHISDVPGLAEQVVKEVVSVMEETEDKNLHLKRLAVLSIQDSTPRLTAKPSLIDAVERGTLPRFFDEIMKCVKNAKAEDKRDVFLRGYIKALQPKYAIVGFLGDAVGYARISRIADHFVSDATRALKLNQSVAAVVEKFDEKTKHVSLSLRPSDVGDEGLKDDTLSLFRSLKYWREILGKESIENSISIGKVTDATIRSTHTYGTSYSLRAGDIDAVAIALEVKKTEATGMSTGTINVDEEDEEGSTQEKKRTERVRIVDIDPFSGVVDVSRDKEIVAGGEKKSILSVGAKFDARILLVKASYIILAVARSKTRTAIAFALAPTVSDQLMISPGAKVSCVVVDKTSMQMMRNLVVVDWSAFHDLKSKTRKAELQVGPEVQKTISFLRGLKSKPEDQDAAKGRRITGRVTRTFATNALIAIAKGVVGNLHLMNVANTTKEEMEKITLGPVPEKISSRYKLPGEGTRIQEAYIAGLRQVPESIDAGPARVELALDKERVSRNKITQGKKILGIVVNVSPRLKESSSKDAASSWTKVAIDGETVVASADVDCLTDNHILDLKVGMLVTCLVAKVDPDGRRVWACISENGKDRDAFFSAIVHAVHPGKGVVVQIPWLARDDSKKGKPLGRVGLCDVSNDFGDAYRKIKALKKGDIVRVRNVKSGKSASDDEEQVVLTMRTDESKDGDDELLSAKSAVSIKKGTKVRGFVKAVSQRGCFVTIGRGLDAHVRLCDLADGFVTDLEKEFPSGKLVEGVVENVRREHEKTTVSMVLRKRPRKKLTETPEVAKLEEGNRVDGTVSRVMEYGALLKLGNGATALLHKNEADQDRTIRNPKDEWCVGQTLHVVIIKVNEKGIKVGTKKCYFEAAGLDEDQAEEIMEANAKARDAAVGEKDDDEKDDVEALDIANMEMDVDGAEIDAHVVDEPNDDDVVAEDRRNENNEDCDVDTTLESRGLRSPEEDVAPLEIARGFNFALKDNEKKDEDKEEESEDEEENENVEEATQSKRSSRDKREKKRQREATETAIRLREEQLANNPDSPETAEDFERLLVGEPNLSVLWIRYMAFCISLSQVDKARSIAERALETISLAEEVERVNVWVAYLNLEAQFGAGNSITASASDALGVKRDAAVFRVFDRACQRITDVKNFHIQAASALRVTSSQLADEILYRATRRFKSSKKVWLAFGEAQFASGNRTGARRTLEKALKALEKRKHIQVISKFAQFEYKYGSPERGRTVFESLAGNFSKRLDLWNVYLDMETGRCRKSTSDEEKNGLVEFARNLFERCTMLDLSSKKMKFIFKKWLSFEKEFGSQESRDVVKNKAREYVERSTSHSASAN